MEKNLYNGEKEKSRGTKTIAVSLTWDDWEFIQFYNISATGILRAKIAEIKTYHEGNRFRIDDMVKKVNTLQEVVIRYSKEIERLGGDPANA